MWNALGEMYRFSFLVYQYPLFWMISNTMLLARFRLASQSRSAALKVIFFCLSWSRDSQKNEWLRLDDLRYRAGFGFGAGHFQGINYQAVLPAFSLKSSRLLLNDLSNEKTHQSTGKKVHFFSKQRKLSKTRESFFCSFFWAKNLWAQLGFW